VLLLLATVPAVALTNSGPGAGFEAIWHSEFGFTFDGYGFRMSLLHWVNDAFLTIAAGTGRHP
jgi:NhaA family Na+:H+ antiporter